VHIISGPTSSLPHARCGKRMPGTERGDSLRSSELDRTDTPGKRKRLMSEQSSRPPERPGEIDIASRATVAYSSETRLIPSST